jgi:hypothetical protein
MDAPVGFITLVQEVDNGDIMLLAIAVTPTDSLLNPLGIPQQIVVHY